MALAASSCCSATAARRGGWAPARQQQQQQQQRRRQRTACRAARSQAVTTTTANTVAAAADAAAAAAAARTAAPAPPQQQQRPAAHRRLRDPAKIGARGSTTVLVPDAGGDVSLAAYMQLPVEQYYCLDPDVVKHLSSNRFTLQVPKIQLLGCSLEPVIQVCVTTEQDAVLLSASECVLNARGIMDGLDERFAMQFQTRLTWKSPQQQHPQHLEPQPQQRQQAQHQREAEQLAAEQQQVAAQQRQEQQQQKRGTSGGGASPSIRAGWDRLRTVGSWGGSNGSNGGGGAGQQQQQRRQQQGQPAVRGSITGSAVVDVWCEVIPPFNLMPREVLVGTCNSVLSGLVNSLLPWFTRQLAADYAKWASDEAYRQARAARSKPAPATGQ